MMQISDTVKVTSHEPTFCGKPLFGKVGIIINILPDHMFPIVVGIDGKNLIFKEDELEKVTLDKRVP